MQAKSTEEIRSEHERTGGAPGKVTLSTWPSRFFISFLIVGVFSFAGLIAYIVSTQQADPEVLRKMELIKNEISASRQDALKGAPGFEIVEDSLLGLDTQDKKDSPDQPSLPEEMEKLDQPEKLDE